MDPDRVVVLVLVVIPAGLYVLVCVICMYLMIRDLRKRDLL